ncbi:MAG: ABC transporter ATP-binding protein [Acidimicrobiaceae bacterium]|nr:ABC transporter ATP-binding protein [Acidimicrobiaceae bacterium]
MTPAAQQAVPEPGGAHATPAVSVKDLDVTLDGTHVLRGVDLAASRGEWVNIIGPNGAGKTTMLRALLGLVAFDGEIVIDGRRDRRRSARACKVAYVPQTPVIPPGMLVADYVLLGRTPHRGMFAAETADDRRIAAEVLARLDLAGFGERTVQSLSGGERQRAVMGRALAQQADVLLLDEPTTALDLGHQQDVLELVDALRRERGLTVIATLHDLTLAARYGDRIAILAQGRVAETGPPAEVLTVQNIEEHFGASVRIVDDPDGPVIVPTTTVSTQNGDQP